MDLKREQLACFESPVRASIIAALRALGPASAKELSQVIGGRPDSFYYHLRHLMKVGLVRIGETRPAETRPEAIYELSAKEFFMREAVGSQVYRESVYRSAKNIIRMAQRHYEDALRRVPAEPVLEDAMRFSFVSARLSKENLAKLKADLEELLLRALATNDADGEPIIYAALLAPTSYRRDSPRK